MFRIQFVFSSLTLTTFFALSALSAPDSYSVYNCTQKCGLTSTSPTSVRFGSISEWEARSALSDLCSYQNLSLQGEASCTESAYNYSLDEHYQRCKKGISPLQGCTVYVNGFKPGDQYQAVFMGWSKVSFDDSEAKALENCRSQVGDSGVCSVYRYLTNQ